MMTAHVMNSVSSEVLTATLSAQSAALSLLLAEMRALSAVMPGVVAPIALPTAQTLTADEAQFDNMPV